MPAVPTHSPLAMHPLCRAWSASSWTYTPPHKIWEGMRPPTNSPLPTLLNLQGLVSVKLDLYPSANVTNAKIQDAIRRNNIINFIRTQTQTLPWWTGESCVLRCAVLCCGMAPGLRLRTAAAVLTEAPRCAGGAKTVAL